MKKHKTIIRTSSKEIYEKFSQLKLFDSIFLENVSKQHLGKILKNINKNKKVVDVEEKNNMFIIRKKSGLDFEIYLK